MRIVFRVDASHRIGTGHVMRCLALAEILRERGSEIIFVCRDLPGNLGAAICQQGFDLFMLSSSADGAPTSGEIGPAHLSWLGVSQETDAQKTREVLQRVGEIDWLVIDHYALDYRWEREFRRKVRRIAAIDDLADRRHDCDLLIDQTYGRGSGDYAEWVPAGASLLLGAEFALLRGEFLQWRHTALKRRLQPPSLYRLLVNLGGVDASNTTGLVMALLARAGHTLPFEVLVVMGAAAPHRHAVEILAAELNPPAAVRVGASDMAVLMAGCDIAIGAAGITSWERCCLGLPSVIVSVAVNQSLIAEQLSRSGAAIHAGTHSEIEQDPDRLLIPLQRLIADRKYSAAISAAASVVVDGRGAERVAQALLYPESGAQGHLRVHAATDTQ